RPPPGHGGTQARAALGRAAPARRAGTRAGEAAEGVAARRAARRARPQAAREHPLRADAPAGQSRPHLHGGHPRPQGGRDARPSRRRHGARPHRPGGHAGGNLRAAALALHRRLHRRREPARGRAGGNGGRPRRGRDRSRPVPGRRTRRRQARRARMARGPSREGARLARPSRRRGELRARAGGGRRLSRRRVGLPGAAAQRRHGEGARRQLHAHDRRAHRRRRPGVPVVAARGRRRADAVTVMSDARVRKRTFGQWLVALVPILWLTVFFLVPFLIVFKISLSQTEIAQPPYSPLLDPDAGWAGVKTVLANLSFATYQSLATDTIYLFSYLKSLEVAALSTAMLLVLGYAVAYGMARAPRRLQPFLVTIVVLPFWTSFLIRVYAWINILQRDGLLNQALLALRIVDEPPAWLATDWAFYLGIVFSYLPFMVLPVSATLEKLDETLLEAAADLGSPPWKTFLQVTLPLSLPGVYAGALLCFIPIVGEFVI